VRYFKVTLLLGLLVSLVVSAFYGAGLFLRPDAELEEFLGLKTPAPHTHSALQYCLIVLLSFGIAWTTIDISRSSLKVLVALGALLELLTAMWVCHAFGVFFSPFPGLSALGLSFAAAFTYSRTEGGMRKRLIRGMFGERISQATFRRLLNSEQPLPLEGRRCAATVVVCEILNQETLAETLSVEDCVAINNAFLSNASDYLVEAGGYLDECDGETLRVVFGSPLADPDHARNACRAVLGLRERLDAVNGECERVWQQMFDFRLGVQSGEVIVAAYGSRRLSTFSVAGEPVEFARRLCTATPLYGSKILIGAGTYAAGESAIEVRPVDLVRSHPNRSEPEEIYELLALKETLSAEERERRDWYWKAVILYRAGKWEESRELLQRAKVGEPGHNPVEVYLERLRQIRAGAEPAGLPFI
jgi:adenylate cyclase